MTGPRAAHSHPSRVSRSPGVPRSARAGFTLVEVVIAVAIMGITLTASLSAVAYAARDRRTIDELRQGHALAASLAREIMSQRFADPQGSTVVPTSTTRSAFNNLTDYANFTESPPTQRDGSSIPEAAGWQRSVAIEPAAVDNTSLAPSITAATTVVLYKVTVTARSPSGKTYALATYRSAFGVPDSSTPSTGLLTGLVINLQSGPQRASINVDLKNQPNP